jgi:uncharacterized membrane protein YphA (DoxX/SURF4 family)
MWHLALFVATISTLPYYQPPNHIVMQLSVFPYLLSYQQLSPVLIRLALGAVFVFWAYQGLRKSGSSNAFKTMSVVEGIIGILLVIGLWTQVATLIAAIGLAVSLIQKIRTKSFLTGGVNYTLILLVLAISLLVTGPGWWAFDYPL